MDSKLETNCMLIHHNAESLNSSCQDLHSQKVLRCKEDKDSKEEIQEVAVVVASEVVPVADSEVAPVVVSEEDQAVDSVVDLAVVSEVDLVEDSEVEIEEAAALAVAVADIEADII